MVHSPPQRNTTLGKSAAAKGARQDKFCTVAGPAPLHQPPSAAAVCAPAELGPSGLRTSAAWGRNEINAVTAKRQEKR